MSATCGVAVPDGPEGAEGAGLETRDGAELGVRDLSSEEARDIAVWGSWRRRTASTSKLLLPDVHA